MLCFFPRWPRPGLAFLIVALAGTAFCGPNPSAAAETVVKRLAQDAAYVLDAPAARLESQTLDLYGPEEKPETPWPVVLFVHGGAWRFGDKAMMGTKPAAFVGHGYLLASANYRLAEPVTPREQAQDVARAVRWLHDHAREHGGDPDRIFLMGHSAGAHLAALVGTDERLLGESGLGPEAVRGVVLLDGAGYDVPKQIAAARLERLQGLYKRAFGDDERAQREASPVAHVVAGKHFPPFLIFHVGQRRDSREQSELLAGKLRDAGGQATTAHEPEKNHLTLNREFGLAGDGPTAKVFEFLDRVPAGK